MGEPKRCRCGSTDFSESNRLRSLGLAKGGGVRCRQCQREAGRRHDKKRMGGGPRSRGAYADQSTVARCRQSRCVICNVAPWTVRRYLNVSMHVGHLVPGDNTAGFEPMCPKCNGFLGIRRLTETTGREVLRRARRYWARLKMRNEAWMHTDVDERGYGFGGVSESPGRQRKLDKFAEEQHARRKYRKGESGRTDSGSPAVPVVGSNDSVVLENSAQERHPED